MDTKIGSRIIANNAAAQPKAGGAVAPVESDTSLREGGPWFKIEEMSSADQETVEGNGLYVNPLRGTGGPGGGVELENEGTPLAGGPFDTLNMNGAGVTATNAGGGVANIAIPGGIALQNEGTPLAGGPFTTLNMNGAGVTATNSGGGVANIVIPGGGAADNSIEVLALDPDAPVVLDPAVRTSILTGDPTGSCVLSLAAGANGFTKRIYVVGISLGCEVNLVPAGTGSSNFGMDGSTSDPDLEIRGTIELTFSTTLDAWEQTGGSTLNFSDDSGLPNCGVEVAIEPDGNLLGLGIRSDPMRFRLRPQHENGDASETIVLEPNIADSYTLGNSSTDPQLFTLAASTIDGHQISFTGIESAGDLRVTITPFDPGEAGNEIELTAGLVGSFGLIWNNDAGYWQLLWLRNWAVNE